MSKSNEKGFIPIILVIIVVFIIIAVIPKGNSDTRPPQTNQAIAENDAEKYCQDAALLGKYLDMSKVSVIDMWNYNKHYVETGKDADGSNIMMLTWNGRVNDQQVGFTCLVSGNNDNIKLHRLAVGGTDLYNLE